MGLIHSGLTAEPVLTLDALKLRAETRWNALVQRDYESAYAFQSPAYRAVYSLEQFKREGVDTATVTRFEVANVKFREAPSKEIPDTTGATDQDATDPAAPPAAMVVVDVEYRIPLAGSGQSGELNATKLINTYREQWLLKDGRWWYISRS